jgi:hypothetical protein
VGIPSDDPLVIPAAAVRESVRIVVGRGSPSDVHRSDTKLLFIPIDQLSRFVRRLSRCAKHIIAPENAVDLDLPIIADEMSRVRRHDLDSATAISKFDRRDHSGIRIDVEIWRLLWHPDLSIDRERIQNQKKLPVIGDRQYLPVSIAITEINNILAF